MGDNPSMRDKDDPYLQKVRDACAAEVRANRARHNLTQVELAERTGLSRITIVRIEAGRRDLTVPQMQAITEAFGVSMAEFMTAVMDATGPRE